MRAGNSGMHGRAVFSAAALLLMAVLFVAGCDSGSPYTPDTWRPGEGYADLDEVAAYLKSLQESYPDFVRTDIIGHAEGAAGLPIYAVTISAHVWEEEAEPEIQVVGGIHGNEQLSCDIALLVIEELVLGIEQEKGDAGRIIRKSSVQIIPMANPWGHAHESRTNAGGVDLNRNFDYAWVNTTYSGEVPFDQDESESIKTCATSEAFVLSLGLHTGAGYVVWGWDHAVTTESAGETYSQEYFARQLYPSYAVALSAASSYADAVAAAGVTGFEVIKGYDWYPAYGTMADWMYGRLGATAFTVELDNRQSFSHKEPSIIADTWEAHGRALLDLLALPLSGIHGTIESENGYPPAVSIEVRPAGDAEHESLPAPYDPDAGDFHVLVPPGEWEIKITASGYTQATGTVHVPDEPGDGVTRVFTLWESTPESTARTLEEGAATGYRPGVPEGYLDIRKER